MRTTYTIVEKFVSINGEGNKSGMLAVFLRFMGCNLNCTYCDTKWANSNDAQYEKLNAEEIYAFVRSTGIQNVTLTGGEPLLQYRIGELLEILCEDERLNVEIETNGSRSISPYIHYRKRPTFTIDYKLEEALRKKMCISNYELLASGDSVKFVCMSISDVIYAEKIINKYKLLDKCSVIFSPVYGKCELNIIADYMKEKKLNGVKLQTQLHKVIWGEEMKGV